MATIDSIQQKLFARLEQKIKGAVTKQSVSKLFKEFDGDNDGFITLSEFQKAIERAGNALPNDEAKFLFAFWDTQAGQHEPRGQMHIELAAQDLVGSQPSYDGQFNSGPESVGGKPSGNKSNKSSQEGGIFGGGSYAADARGGDYPAPSYGGAPPDSGDRMRQPLGEPTRPRGNQSSVPGGIFNQQAENAQLSQRGGGNKSNQSSLEGGIFGEVAQQQVRPEKVFNSNRSSIPGGIFG